MSGSNVVPIPKNADHSKVWNFRPISILPILSNLLKRVVQDQVKLHLQTLNLLCDCQCGFREGYSTQDVLQRVTDSWRVNVDQGKYVGAVFLDLSKAFDTVSHNILLSKLPYYGITGKTLDWFTNYLTNRTHSIGNDVSTW